MDEITSSKKQRNLRTGNDGRDYEKLDSSASSEALDLILVDPSRLSADPEKLTQ